MTGFYNRALTLQSPVVTTCNANLTFNNSTFFSNSVFMCFAWIWEQRATISLYSINCLVFITERKCVYCAARAEYLYVLCGSENKQRLFLCTALTVFFYNWEEMCLLRGTDWVFKSDRCTFLVKVLIDFWRTRDNNQHMTLFFDDMGLVIDNFF